MTRRFVTMLDDNENPATFDANDVVMLRPALRQEEKDGKVVSITISDMVAVFFESIGQPLFLKSTLKDASRQILGIDPDA